MNIYKTWLELLRPVARSVWRNLAALDGLRHKTCDGIMVNRKCLNCGAKHVPVAEVFKADPPTCPTELWLSQEERDRLYGDPDARAAMDAWDQQYITSSDIYNMLKSLRAHISGCSAP